MKILIAVPSKNRAKILKDNAYEWLRHIASMGWDVAIFIEPQDVPQYLAEFQGDNNPGLSFPTLPENDMGLCYAKKRIKKYAEERGYDLIFKVDDDVRGFTHWRKNTKGQECAMVVAGFLERFLKDFSQHLSLSAIGFPYSHELFEAYDLKPTKRLQTAYIVRTEYYCAPIESSFFEDFAVGINILVSGGKIFRYGRSGIHCGVKVGGGTGGLQDFDRAGKAAAEIDELRKLYPPLKAKKVDKPWGFEPDLRSVKL